MLSYLRSDFELPFGASMVVGFVLLVSAAWVADTLSDPCQPIVLDGEVRQIWNNDTQQWSAIR